MSRRRIYEDDDGRTIADMGGVTRPGMFGHLPGGLEERRADHESETEDFFSAEEKDLLPKEQRRWYILGAMKGALLIGLVYIVGMCLVILLMLLAWGVI